MAKLSLTSLIFFCDEISDSVDEVRAGNTIFFYFSKVLYGIFTAKFMRDGLDSLYIRMNTIGGTNRF